MAQARIFDTIMQGEIAELELLVASMEQVWLRRCDSGMDGEDRPPEGLVRMRGQVLEAQRLLEEDPAVKGDVLRVEWHRWWCSEHVLPW